MGLAVQRSFDELGTPLSEVTFVVLDVETTGGSPATSSLTEVAAARYRGGELLGTFQTFVRPDERIPPFITALTGISDDMVADAPSVGAMLPWFLEFLGGAVIVGHNVRFDLSFLDHALVSTGRDRLDNATVDTLALARRLVRDMVPNCKLGTLAAVLRLPHQPSHRALTDVLATGDLLHAMLERAGSFGIVGLQELLDLPKLVGHPQAAKLKLTVRLPHRPGVYWFSDATGNVLYVGKATDLQTRVRSYFTADRRPKIGRLLRQLHAVHHWVCPGPFSAGVLEGRLIRAWSPPYNRQGVTHRKPSGGAVGPDLAVARRPTPDPTTGPIDDPSAYSAASPGELPGSTRPARRRRHRTRWTDEQLSGDATGLLSPLADEVSRLAAEQCFEEAAARRDETDRLRQLLIRQRRLTSLQNTGRMALLIEGEGTVELDGGLVTEQGMLFGAGQRTRPDDARISAAMAGDGHQLEVVIVSQWLHTHAHRVRILEVEAPEGWSMPAARIPTLRELLPPRRPSPRR